MNPTNLFWMISLGLIAFIDLLALFVSANYLWMHIIILPLFALGIWDLLQKKRAILRNFPIIGHFRYLMEMIRPELQQYFVESNLDGRPINRETRSVVYQRAKGQLQTLPFGTQNDVYAEGYEWVEHSMHPVDVSIASLGHKIGGAQCKQPYEASIFNISGMSYGSLSAPAIRALGLGAKMGSFYHNTGEGGVSPYHLEAGADLVWQIGTGYFGCRSADGNFCADTFQKVAANDCIKMIELKLSQGAKPGHGGILPGRKVTKEISEIRGVPLGQDVLSPPAHKAFSDAEGLALFIQKLRELSGGKPVGLKLCVGHEKDFENLVTEMIRLKIVPDFITVDGAEGGTGAAPLEFSNSIGKPLKEGLSFVHRTLLKAGIRNQVTLIAAGKVFTGFQMVTVMALGADVVNSARGMMLALGCIQALRCNSNKCPTGVTSTNPVLSKGLDVTDKSYRVHRYHQETIKAFSEILGAMGLQKPQQIRPAMVQRRFNDLAVKNYEQIYFVDQESSC